MATYNGHKNYDYWNVSLWLGNDEGLYLTALDMLRSYRNVRDAARAMLEALPRKTPDGAAYTIANLTAALRGLKD